MGLWVPDDLHRHDVRNLRDMENNVYSNHYSVTSDSLQVYLRQISTIPLLSREEEVELRCEGHHVCCMVDSTVHHICHS